MGRFALLIGVSESREEDLPALPWAIADIKAMESVLQNPDLGGFDSVTVMANPTREEMELAIETLFTNCKREDLVLCYFSGHGMIDNRDGKFYLVLPQTRKVRGELVRTTAVAGTFLQYIMTVSRSKHQVLILDSCFSAAIADGMTVKSAGRVDIQRDLGGEGRAILTSSSALEKSVHIQGYDLSIYTHYLVEGIQTGAANQNGGDYITVKELHEYVEAKLQLKVPQMSPRFFPVREGYEINLVRSLKPKVVPELENGKEAERQVESGPPLKTCMNCKGSGEQKKVQFYTSMGTPIYYTDQLEPCYLCGGLGQVPSSMRKGFLGLRNLVNCWGCGRSGIAYNSVYVHCPSCGKNLFPQKR